MPESFSAPRSAILAVVAIGAVAIAALSGLALAQKPPRLVRIGAPGITAIGVNGVHAVLGVARGDVRVCQSGEVLPAGISAVRVSLWAFLGAPVRVSAFSGTRLLTEGTHDSDWTGTSVTVPVRPLARSVSGADVCVTIAPNQERLEVLGNPVPSTQAATAYESSGAIKDTGAPHAGGQRLNGRMVIEYLQPGRKSWFSSVLAVTRRLGLGRAYSGTWIAVLIAALMAAVAVLAVRLTLREQQ